MSSTELSPVIAVSTGFAPEYPSICLLRDRFLCSFPNISSLQLAEEKELTSKRLSSSEEVHLCVRVCEQASL